MAQASYSKLTQREIDRAETDLLINLSITKEKRKDYSSENSGESSDQPENDLSVVKPDAAIQSGSKWGT
ncbi:hypothetical protein M8680_24320, partial [Escherichia coli]|nr:hypothetical protein [Escherichia coli]MCL7916043.1 hypothetical protein [Escherichia coli]